jgi:hypothetical protein
MAIKRSPPKLDKDDLRAGVPIELCLDNTRARDFQWFWKWEFFEDQAQDRRPLSNLIYVLDRLPTLLKHAAENHDLITFASQRTIFPQQAFCFPRLRKRAQNALNAYLTRFPATPPAIPVPEYRSEGPGEHWERKLRIPWDRISISFPRILAFSVYICFLWVTCFA